MLDGLVESLPTARLLLLVNYRPEYHHTWGSKTYYRQVRIDALPSASAEELLEALLGSDPTLRPLKPLLLERTEGNPFFLEESVVIRPRFSGERLHLHLEIAEALGDFDLRILATGYLEMTFYCRGDYSRGSELRGYDPAALLAGGVSERVSGHYGFGVASSILGNWTWLIMSLAELGRLAEAAERAAQVLRMADATHNLFTIGLAHRSASTLQLIKGDWAKSLSLTHRWVQVVREGNLVIQLPTAAAASAWALAQAGATTEA